MEQTSNRYLAQAPIGSLMLKFAVPCILSLLVSSLYNIVDQIFIGWGVGYLGNGATNVVFPITVIALAAALMIGDGCAAFLSICQGKHDTESAHRSVGNAMTLLLVCSAVLVVLFVVFRNAILAAFGATENNLPYAIDYFNVIIIGIPFYIVTNGLNSIIRADGSPKFAMLSTLVGCIMNVILDPLPFSCCTGASPARLWPPSPVRSSPLSWGSATCSGPAPSACIRTAFCSGAACWSRSCPWASAAC